MFPAKGSLSYVAPDGDARAEMHDADVGGRRDKLGAGAPQMPIAQVAAEACLRVAIFRAERFRMRRRQTFDFRVDQRQALRGDVIRMRRHRPLGQRLDRVAFLDEGAAHFRAAGSRLIFLAANSSI
jgi:hypothetical protein